MQILNFAYLDTSFAYSDWVTTNILSTSWHSGPRYKHETYIFYEYDEHVRGQNLQNSKFIRWQMISFFCFIWKATGYIDWMTTTLQTSILANIAKNGPMTSHSGHGTYPTGSVHVHVLWHKPRVTAAILSVNESLKTLMDSMNLVR